MPQEELSSHESSLRKSAEEKLNKQPAKAPSKENNDVQKIVYELEVHQAELEIQNEELRHSQEELTDSRNRYEELYDFAPVGYLTLNHEGRILEANLTAAKMFGLGRSKLIHKLKFSAFVSPQSQDIWYKYRMGVLESKGNKSCELDIVKWDHTSLSVGLETICLPTHDEKGPRLMMAMIDLTERNEAEILKRFNRAFVDRELRMIEMKKEVNALLRNAGLPPKYMDNLDDLMKNS